MVLCYLFCSRKSRVLRPVFRVLRSESNAPRRPRLSVSPRLSLSLLVSPRLTSSLRLAQFWQQAALPWTFGPIVKGIWSSEGAPPTIDI